MFELKDLISNNITRRSMLEHITSFDKKVNIHVYRNHSFELIENTINVYLEHSGICASFTYSAYDDSFSFKEKNENASIYLLWMDLTRYRQENVEDFINKRIIKLQESTAKPIILIPIGINNPMLIPNIVSIDVLKIKKELGATFFDDRLEAIAGTRLSSRALMEISKLLGLKFIPALVNPGIKAIVLDLDNTLYKGILGEDGPTNLILTEGHFVLQKKIKSLVEEGILIAIASKNEQSDVAELFEKRKDFPLKEKDFTKICASWKPKTEMIEEISKFFNIGIDSILFIDDNIGEISAVMSNYPQINTLIASEDGGITEKLIDYYPGLTKLSTIKEDFLRKNDIVANEKRRSIQKTLSSEEYLESLKIVLQFKVNAAEEEKRIFELSNKTNQFIFTYKRYKLEEVSDIIKKEEYCVVTISLKDILTDSGIIGVCVGKKEANYVAIEEIFISCRALGRGIEETIIKSAIKIITEELKETRILIKFIKGERNIPAENFVNQFFSQFIFNPSEFEYTLPKKGVKIVKG